MIFVLQSKLVRDFQKIMSNKKISKNRFDITLSTNLNTVQLAFLITFSY